MEQKKYFFAVDLGATSGRTILGSLSDGKVRFGRTDTLRQPTHRNGQSLLLGHLCPLSGNHQGLETRGSARHPHREHRYRYLGMRLCICGQERRPSSATLWPTATLIPFGMMEKYFDEKISKEKVYEKTGIQFMNFNSLFQIYAMRKAGNVALENADKILFIPDALSYMLTGNAICEYTVASTSQILNPMTGDLDNDLVESLGLKSRTVWQDDHPCYHHRHTHRRGAEDDGLECRSCHRRSRS